MHISTMTIGDYDEVYALWMSTPNMGLNATDDARDGIEQYLRRNPTTCFVAREGDELIGVILSGHDGRRGMIHHMAVKLSERNRGIGGALLDHAMQALEAEGIHKVALVVFDRNQIGNAFWESHGFTARHDLVYRNKNIHALDRIDT